MPEYESLDGSGYPRWSWRSLTNLERRLIILSTFLGGLCCFLIILYATSSGDHGHYNPTTLAPNTTITPNSTITTPLTTKSTETTTLSTTSTTTTSPTTNATETTTKPINVTTHQPNSVIVTSLKDQTSTSRVTESVKLLSTSNSTK